MAKHFAKAEVFFPAANVANFSQAADPVATAIAVANLLYAVVATGAQPVLERLPEDAAAKKLYQDICSFAGDTAPTRNPLKLAFRTVGREVSNPLRVTSYCALVIGSLLLAKFSAGSSVALFPGLAALSFGIGNYIQTSPSFTRIRENPKTNKTLNAFIHPAVWYGLGYVMTGLGIGGGLAFLANPFGNVSALALTTIGISETAGSLGLLASGRIQNQAAPFVGVALGTTFFAAAGLITGNLLGFVTGLFACAGESALGVVMQKKYNQLHSLHAEP